MQSLARAVTRMGISSEPMPTVFSCFDRMGMRLRRAEVNMIAGPPGSAKSAIAVKMAIAMGVPTLYVSSDTNAFTMATRAVSMLTGLDLETVERKLGDDPEWGERVLESVEYIRWYFTSDPSLYDIDLELAAYEEVYGRPPEFIVIDNLMDVDPDGVQDETYQSWQGIIAGLKSVARETEACVLILHHTSEGVSGNPCPPRSAIQGKVSQIPAVIFTSALVGPYMYVAPVKNRQGPADKEGRTYASLQVDLSRMDLREVQPTYPGSAAVKSWWEEVQ